MDIEGLGDVIVETLVDKGMVKDVADIYKLTVEDIANLERKAEKSAIKLIDQIEASKTRGLERLLYGIDIRHVGERTAKDPGKACPKHRQAFAGILLRSCSRYSRDRTDSRHQRLSNGFKIRFISIWLTV